MTLPPAHSGSLIRTDFSDDARWAAVRDAAFEPDGDGFTPAQLTVVDDVAFDGASGGDVLLAVPEGTDGQYIMLADATTMADGTFLVLNPTVTPDRFRTSAAGVASIDNNLAIANMDFEEFAGAADPDGVFRGF